MCSFHDKSLVIITPSSFALLTASSWLPFTRIGWNSDYFLVKEILSSFHFSLFSWTLLSRDHWGTQSAICCALLVPPLATTSDVVVPSIIIVGHFHRTLPHPSKVKKSCKSFIQCGVPNCLGNISNLLETVPSAPVTIGMTSSKRQFQIFQVTVIIDLLSFLAYYSWCRMGRQHQL